MFTETTTVMFNDVQRIKAVLPHKCEPETIDCIRTNLYLIDDTHLVFITRDAAYLVDSYDFHNEIRRDIKEYRELQ